MRKEMARGAAWMVLFRLFDRSIGLISTAILARLLVPADFGLVAMAMTVIAIVELVTAFGFDIALIQKSDPQREHFDTAWTLNILLWMSCALVIALAAWPTAQFYGDERLKTVLWVIAGAWALYGFENTGTANFRREMNFRAEFRFMASKRVLGFTATLAAALILRSYWALVIGTIVGRLGGVTLSYLLHPFRPRLTLVRTRELLGFSGWMLANNLLGVLTSKVSHLYVGRVFGAQAIGAYSVGAEIAQMVHTELIAPINRAMFPGYSRMASDRDEMLRTCLGATSVIMLLVIPMSVGVAVLAGPFVRLLLGPQWSMAVPLIEVLALTGALSAITSNNVSVYFALGRPHLVTTILAARLTVMAVCIHPLAQRHGLVGVAYAEVLGSVVSMLVSLPTLFLTLRMKVSDYLRALWRPLLSSAVMGAAIVWLIEPRFEHAGERSALVELAAGVGLGAVVFALVLGTLWLLSGRPRTAERLLVEKAIGLLRSRLQRPRPT